MSLIFISEYNQTYHTHKSCYYCLEVTLCYLNGESHPRSFNHETVSNDSSWDSKETIFIIFKNEEEIWSHLKQHSNGRERESVC